MPFIKNENTTVQQAMQQAGQMVTQVMKIMQDQKMLREIERNNDLQHQRLMASQAWKAIGDLAAENPGGLKGVALDYPDLIKDWLYRLDPKARPDMVETRLRQLQNGALSPEHLKETLYVGAITLGDEFESRLGLREKEIMDQGPQAQAPTTQPSEAAVAKPEVGIAPTAQPPLEAATARLEHGPWTVYDKLIAEGKPKGQAIGEVRKGFKDNPLYKQEYESFKNWEREKWEKGLTAQAEVIKTAPAITKVIDETKRATPQGKQEIVRYNKMLDTAGFFDNRPIFSGPGVKAKLGAAKRYSGWIAKEVEKLGPKVFAEYYNGMMQRYGGFERLRREIEPESMKFMELVSNIIARNNLLPFEQDKSRATTAALWGQVGLYAAQKYAMEHPEIDADPLTHGLEVIMKQTTEAMEIIQKQAPDVSVNDLVAPESAHYDPSFAGLWEAYLNAYVSLLGVQGFDAKVILKDVTVQGPGIIGGIRTAVGLLPWWGKVPAVSFGTRDEEEAEAAREAREADLPPEQRARLEASRR